jgi:hypothetical protein
MTARLLVMALICVSCLCGAGRERGGDEIFFFFCLFDARAAGLQLPLKRRVACLAVPQSIPKIQAALLFKRTGGVGSGTEGGARARGRGRNALAGAIGGPPLLRARGERGGRRAASLARPRGAAAPGDPPIAHAQAWRACYMLIHLGGPAPQIKPSKAPGLDFACGAWPRGSGGRRWRGEPSRGRPGPLAPDAASARARPTSALFPAAFYA